MLAWTSHERQRLLSTESRKRFEEARQDPALFNNPAQLRAALLDFVADFANWDNSVVSEYLHTSRTLTQVAHKALGGLPGGKPLIIDPFAGGGAIPLEALRVGAEAYASDLNPLATLIGRVVLEHVPEFGAELSDEVQKFADWLKPQAHRDLSAFFPPDKDGWVPIAYLWSRTILSEAPSAGENPIEVPMIRSMWLTRGRKNGNWAIRWVTDKNGKPKTDLVDITVTGGATNKVRRPAIEIFKPTKPSQVPAGTIRGGAVTCPITGYTTPVKRVRAQLTARRGGTKDARMYCVVMASPTSKGRRFRAVTPADVAAAERASRALAERFSESDLLNEDLPPDGTNGFRVHKYGMRSWGDLFTGRQTLALLTYSKLARTYVSEFKTANGRLKVALESVVALLVNRLADLNASLCVWQLNTPNTAHVFGRWALPMVFDFGEVNPIAAGGGSPESALRRIHAAINDLVAARLGKGTVLQGTATSIPLADDMAAAVVTDPPYYDAIPYSDLMDFFVVWMKRVCRIQTFMLANGLSPKEDECVVDNSKNKDHEFFGRTMTQSMTEARRVLAPNGICVVVFAHKSTSGWEAQLESLIGAGFSITASWPIDTEMASRMRAKGSAALASSVHLVCRPRGNPDGTIATEEIGEWREVLSELPRRIHDWMPRLAEEGVVGADAIFACLGPALEIYSRYSCVEKASGELVLLKEFLEQVWAAVAKEALALVFKDADATGFEPDARLTAMWLWTMNAGSNYSGATDTSDDDCEEDDATDAGTKMKLGGFAMEYDASRKIAQGLGANLEALSSVVEVSGHTARLLPVAERARHLFGKQEGSVSIKQRGKTPKQADFFAEMIVAEEPAEYLIGGAAPKRGETALDRVHQSMILFGTGRGEALKRFLVEDGIGREPAFWRLAQALSALYPVSTDEKRWIDGVLARKKGLGF